MTIENQEYSTLTDDEGLCTIISERQLHLSEIKPRANYIPQRGFLPCFETVLQAFKDKKITAAELRNYEIKLLYNRLHFELSFTCNQSIDILSELTYLTKDKGRRLTPESIRRCVFTEINKTIKKLKVA